MPNWCDNRVFLKHDDPKMLRRAQAAYRRGKFAQAFLPMPAGYLKDQKWVHWRAYHWGTKWDFGEGDYGRPPAIRDDGIELRFDTAWAPPLPVYLELVRLGYAVDAAYYEPNTEGCGQILGRIYTAVGIDCWKPKCIRHHIDADLVKKFRIDDNARRDRSKCTHGRKSWCETNDLEIAITMLRLEEHRMQGVLDAVKAVRKSRAD
jgi:hypothetical protein